MLVCGCGKHIVQVGLTMVFRFLNRLILGPYCIFDVWDPIPSEVSFGNTMKGVGDCRVGASPPLHIGGNTPYLG